MYELVLMRVNSLESNYTVILMYPVLSKRTC